MIGCKSVWHSIYILQNCLRLLKIYILFVIPTIKSLIFQGQLATLVTSEDGSQSDGKSGMSQVQTIRMILRNADGTETEQNLPVSSARGPTLLTNDGQEVQLSDENQLQMISTIVEQAASGGLADGNNQVGIGKDALFIFWDLLSDFIKVIFFYLIFILRY